jgi:hypothetical protein
MRRLLVSARIAPHSETDALAVRHACDVADDGHVWRESYAPGAFIAAPTPAPVVLRHDGPSIGYEFSVTPHGAWFEAELAIECDDE